MPKNKRNGVRVFTIARDLIERVEEAARERGMEGGPERRASELVEAVLEDWIAGQEAPTMLRQVLGRLDALEGKVAEASARAAVAAAPAPGPWSNGNGRAASLFNGNGSSLNGNGNGARAALNGNGASANGSGPSSRKSASPKRAGGAKQREKRREAVWNFLALQANGSATTPPLPRTALQEATGITAKGVQTALQDLIDGGQIAIASEGRGAKANTYQVVERPGVSAPAAN